MTDTPRAPECIFCRGPIKTLQRVIVTILMRTTQTTITRPAHGRCLHQFESRADWQIVSVLQWSLHPPHVSLTDWPQTGDGQG